MKLSVTICAYNEQDWVNGTLESLLTQQRRPDEIIVVNNASTDNTAEIVQRFLESHPEWNIRLIYEGKKGLHHARETAWRSATGDIVVTTDADIRFPNKWLQIFEEEFAVHPDVAAMSGPVRYYDALPFINWFTWFFEQINQPQGIGKLFSNTYHLNGGNSAYRRLALEAVNGYLDKPRDLVEDMHIQAKLSAANFALRYVRRNKVWHTFRRFNKDGWRGYVRYMFGYTLENVYADQLQDG
ncbi:MAG TPA: glycosyltransferase family 2 protein [Aggregatilineales bacterium]|nr:glycosyltransferase family 2 protein [Aggregatilineales bacterium]